jgi:predicted transglutaminase-like cysteine proteinase
MLKYKLVAAAAIISIFAGHSAFAAGPGGFARGLNSAPLINYISEKRRTMAPLAHVMFCARNPSECKVQGTSSQISLNTFASRQMQSVNSAVNRSIRPLNDRGGRDGEDVWQVNVTSGDCEDFALTKRDHLIGMGWSSKALRIAVARTSSGEGHAVLVIRTDQGDMVLDNRTNVIKNWKDTDLRWVMIQSGENPRIWYEL